MLTGRNVFVRRCIAAEPHHGERWTAVSKAVENLRMKTEAILKRVVGDMAKEKAAL